MKTTYFKTLAAILVTASAMAGFVSCERPDNTGNGNDDGQDSTLVEIPAPEILPAGETTIQVPAEGGVFTIEYILENPVDGGKAIASSEAEWITDVICPGDGTVVFTVEPNQDYEVRTGEILVGYEYPGNAIWFSTVIEQQAASEPPAPAYDIEIEGAGVYGSYMGRGGELYSCCRYNFFLTDTGFNETGNVLPNSIYIRMDLFSDEEPADLNAIYPPEGTYVIDFSGDYPEMTISGNDCYYMMTDGNGMTANMWWFEDCTCTVTWTDKGYRIDIVALLAGDGRVLHAYYEGDEAFTDRTL